MSKARYQLLSTSDRTPALEVNLLAAAGANTSTMSEINLNENERNTATTASPAAASAPSADPSVNSESVSVNLPYSPQPPPLAGAAAAASAAPAFELPSYNEALKLKKLEASEIPPSYNSSIGLTDTPPIITIDAADLRAIAEASDSPMSAHELNQEIGSECMFLSAFMIAFFFNWIGFFISICLLQNPAGKYGALSGFGLSMAKWVTIVKYQDWMTNMNDFQQKLFFWLFVFIGFYLFFRGLINYTTLKYRPGASAEYARRNRNRIFWFVE